MIVTPYVLRFGAATTDRVAIAPSTSTNNLDPWTVIIRGKQSSQSGGRNFFGKGFNGSNTRHIECHVSGTNTGNIQVALDRATGDLTYTSTGGPMLLGPSAPFLLAVTFNSANAANTLVKAYVSFNGGPFVPVSWGTTTDGSGAFQSDVLDSLCFGNLSTGSTNSYQGLLWRAHLLADELNLGVLNTTQLQRFTRLGSTRGLWTFGANGTGVVIDESGYGNHGTITGATLASDPYALALGRPLPLDFKTIAATGGGPLFAGGPLLKGSLIRGGRLAA